MPGNVQKAAECHAMTKGLGSVQWTDEFSVMRACCNITDGVTRLEGETFSKRCTFSDLVLYGLSEPNNKETMKRYLTII